MRESAYQVRVRNDISEMLPGCIILKNDASYLQGVPDLLILYKSKWAMLEIKRSARANVQPNQEYYVDLFDNMSFAAFIYPEIHEEVLNDLQSALQPRRTTRVPIR